MSRRPRKSVRRPVRLALAARLAARPDHPFAVGVGPRLGYVLAGRDWALPYATISFVGVSERDTLTEEINAVFLQVMVFARESLAAEELAADALDLFAGAPLSGDGVHDFVLRRFGDVPTLPETQADATVIWQAGVTLAGLVQTKP